MRFATTNGNIIDVYQATTQMTDESGQSYPYTIDTLLDRALGPEGYYGAFVANMHTDFNPWSESDAIVLSAMDRGVPVISARQLLAWLDGRNGSSLQPLNRSNNLQTFSVTAHPSARGLQVLVPIPSGYEVTNITFNGTPTGFSLRAVKGIHYALLPATNGNYEVDYALDVTPPGVADISPESGQTGVGYATRIMAEFTEPMNSSTVNTNTVILRDSQGTPVPATVSYDAATFAAVLIPISPLAPATTCSVTVKGGVGGVADVSSNHLAGDFTWSFSTEGVAPFSIGNTNNGTIADILWDGGAWINAARFQATSNRTVSVIRAKVAAIAGHYKCAIYAGNNLQPNELLRSTLEVTNPATGWQDFPLTSALTLTNGNYYWLAIWSDNPAAVVYYSGTDGTLRWFQYSTTAPGRIPSAPARNSPFNYCIFAATDSGPVTSNLVIRCPADTITNLILSGTEWSGACHFCDSDQSTNGVLGHFKS